MQGILFFDTETTGKPRNYKAPMTDVDNWPRLVQLGWIAYEEGTYVGHKEYIIRPSGFTISAEVSAIHGITTEKAMEQGQDIGVVLRDFVDRRVQPSDIIVGHNVEFDLNVVGAECLRRGWKNPFEGKVIIDTMKSSANFCAIPGLYGNKWPKLTELWAKLFPDTPYPQTHTALDDIQHTAKCYFELERLGVIKVAA
jgi:DNA polymerase-3 subunit epsilon